MGRPARSIPPGTVYPASVIVREVERDYHGRRFVVRRTCGHEVAVRVKVLGQRCRRCQSCDRRSVTLSNFARAMRPDSLDHVGTVGALERGEAT